MAWFARGVEALSWAGLITLWILLALWAFRLGESVAVLWVATAVLHLVLFGAWVVLGVGLILRRRILVLAAVVTIAAQLVVTWPLLPWSGSETANADPVTVASINLYDDNPDTNASIRAIAEDPPDILAIQEFTPAARTAMDEVLGPDQYPHRIAVPVEGTAGKAIYSRFAMTQVDSGETAAFTLTADVDVPDGGQLRVFNVHTFGPQAGDPGIWIRSFHELDRVLAETDGSWIAIGDYNATVDHRVYRDLLRGDRHDAHLMTGRGSARSWPANKAIPPFVLIDHAVLSGDLVATGTRERTIRGADHRLIEVDLDL